jgi:hypothetical protein
MPIGTVVGPEELKSGAVTPKAKKCVGHTFVFDVPVNINHESVSSEGITDGSRFE